MDEALERYIPMKYRTNLFYVEGFRTQLLRQMNFHPGSWHTFTPDQKEIWQKGARMAVLVKKRHGKPAIACWECKQPFYPVSGERYCGCTNDKSLLGIKSPDKSWNIRRTIFKHSELERAFAREWIEENRPSRWLNFGFGLLQDLFMIGLHRFDWPRAMLVVNPRERMIAATVVQWLGTNCGFNFLRKVLESCGYSIVETKGRERKYG